MFFLRIIYCIALILLFSITVLWGQNASKKRLKESDINIEKLFIEATREKILGNTDEAIALYLEILKKDQENAAVNYELARIYKSQKQFDKAIINAQEAVVLDQFNVYYNKLYANLLEQEANYMKASDLYELLVKEYPDSEKLYFEWASLLSRNNQDEKAIKVYNSLEKRMGISAVVTMRKYKLYLALNKDKKAAMELEKLIHQFPQECDYIIRLANFYAKRKEMDKAKEWYQKALNVDPNNAPANLAMVEFYMQTGDTTRYLQALNSVFESSNYSIKSKLNAFKPLVERLLKDELIKHKESI